MKANEDKINKGIENRCREYFSKEAKARGLVILDAADYEKMIERKEQLEKAVDNFQMIMGSK